MNPLAKLDHFNLSPTAKSEVAALIQSLLDQADRDAALLQSQEAAIKAKEAAIQAKDVKIEALTFELAYYKRLRFSVKNERWAPLQRDVFEETWTTDLSAIEAEVEQLQDDQPCETVVKPKRPRAGRQPLPDHLPRLEHRHEPESCTCGQCGNGLVKIGDDCRDAGGRATQKRLPETSANNWMSNPPSFSSTVTSAHSMLAEPAKP